MTYYVFHHRYAPGVFDINGDHIGRIVCVFESKADADACCARGNSLLLTRLTPRRSRADRRAVEEYKASIERDDTYRGGPPAPFIRKGEYAQAMADYEAYVRAQTSRIMKDVDLMEVLRDAQLPRGASRPH